MNLKIKIYCILLAVIFVISFAYSTYNDRADIKKSFVEGYNSAYDKSSISKNIQVKIDPIKEEPSPMMLHNETNGEDIPIIPLNYETYINIPLKSLPTHLFILEIISYIFTAFLVIALIAFPIIFFNIVYNVTKSKIISDGTILKMRVLGFTLIGWWIMSLIIHYINYETLKLVIDTTSYKISNNLIEVYTLILGLITLLISELIKVSLKMKEEQDLTI